MTAVSISATSDPAAKPPPAAISLVDVKGMAQGLRHQVITQAGAVSFIRLLTEYVSARYTLLPRRKAWCEADVALCDFYPNGPPPASSSYRYMTTLAPCYTGWDRERCQRLCAAVHQAYQATYPFPAANTSN